jgi:tRNA modification GTPase
MNDTIAAIATPLGSGGIGIIRISGNDAERVARRLFRRKGPNGCASSSDLWTSHHFYHGHIVEQGSERFIDEVLLVLMRAPRSYTREDVIEIQCHGGAVVLIRILEEVLGQGVRQAEPGEFTRRAFLNGRIDLSQAEAVADVINARSRQALDIAAGQLTGQLKMATDTWIDRLNLILTEVQAEIEFGDEIEPNSSRESTRAQIETEMIAPIQRMLKDFEQAHVLRDGVRISISGRPNVGKSSLLNRLIRNEKAIVTDVAGTTRDPIEHSYSIQGMPVLLVDTAGLRVTCDPIESIGVRKAHEAIEKADLVLFVVEATDPMNREDLQALESIAEQKIIVVVNKIDLLEEGQVDQRKHRPMKPGQVVNVSALNGSGIDRLEDAIAEQCFCTAKLAGPMVVPTIRQKGALEQALEVLQRACLGLHEGIPDELIACDLSEALAALRTITGESVEADLLDQIFSRFCIGK